MSDSLQPPFPDRLACVIFDMDGTLTKTNDLIFASFNHVAEKYLHKRLSPREIIALFGPPEEGGLQKLLGRENVDDAMDDLCAFYASSHAGMAFTHPGIEEVLGFLKGRGVKLSLFTGKGRRTTGITLEQLGLARFFDLVVSGTDVARHKPDPEGIQKVLHTFSLNPAEVLMVGDSLSDVKASRAAGVRMAGVVWDSYDRDQVLNTEVEYKFQQVEELFRWLHVHFPTA